MRKLFSLIAAVLFAGSMMAEVVTITPENCGWNGTAGAQSGVVEGVTVANSNGLAGTDQSTGVAAMRIYKSATLTISASSNITSIVFTCADNGTAKFGPGCFADQTGYTYEADGPTGTWTGSAKSVSFTASANQVRATQIVVTLEDGGETPEPVEQYYLVGSMNGWVISEDYKLALNTAAEGTEYKIDITLAEGNQEMKVKGVLEGRAEDVWYPAGMDNNFTINDAGDYTIYFRPNADGGDDWYEGYIFAEYHAPAVPKTCAEVYNMAKNDVVDLLNDVVVTYANGKNVWVRDATASMLLYLSANTTWKAGDVLSGVAGVVDIYNGVTEIKPSAAQVSAVTATEGEAPAAIELAAVAATDVNKYIVMKGVAVEGTFAEGTASNITIANGEGTIVLRNNFKNGFAFDAEKTYDIYAVVTIYNNNPQLYFITAEEVAVEPQPGVPAVAAPAPEWPANQVKSLYSDSYKFAPASLNSYNEAWWDQPNMVEEEIEGNHMLHYDLYRNGMIGVQFAEISVAQMEKIHLDIFSDRAGSLRFRPITAGGPGDALYKELVLEADQWNSFDIDTAEFSGHNWAQLFQYAIQGFAEGNMVGANIWVDNVFFYTTVAPAADTEAPANFTAVKEDESFFSAKIKVHATDNSGSVLYDVINGELIIASGSGASDADAYITIDGLTPNTAYNFSVIAKDETGNAAEPVAVSVTTLVAPAAAPAPTAEAADVKSIYSNAYAFAPESLSSYNEYWWEPTAMAEGQLAEGDDVLFYAAKATGMIGWQFGEMDLTDYTELHIDIYPMADGSIEIYPVNNTDPKGEYKGTYQVAGGQWNSLVIDLSEKDLTKIFQIGWINYYALNGFFIDNVYFAKPAPEEEGIDNTNVEMNAVKFVENGNIIIEKNGVKYTVFGQIVK